MVQLSNKLLSSRKKQLWIDSLRIYCKAGSGGNGTPSYGGLGGPGGSVTIKVASEAKARKKKNAEPTNLTELFKHTFKSDPLKQRVEASHGKHSSKNRLNGEKGEDKGPPPGRPPPRPPSARDSSRPPSSSLPAPPKLVEPLMGRLHSLEWNYLVQDNVPVQM